MSERDESVRARAPKLHKAVKQCRNKSESAQLRAVALPYGLGQGAASNDKCAPSLRPSHVVLEEREGCSHSQAPASMPPRLFFIRHGEAAHNPLLVKGNFKSKDPAEVNYALLSEARSIVNPSLTDKGREQALALHESLVASGEKFDLCVTTPLARAIETAQIAIGSLAAKFLVTPELCETPVPRSETCWATARSQALRE